jgi:serine/threonine protein phosphatase PrpC
MLSWLGLGQVRARAAERAESEASSPVETVTDVSSVVTFVGGGAQTRGALPVTTEALEGAVYSSRGRGYAPYNEDAACLFRDHADGLLLGAFDQAGGLGGRVRGAASRLAAERAFVAFRALSGGAAAETVERRLADALGDAHARLLERDEGEVTTAVLAALRPGGEAILATSGDSAALWFDAEGAFRAMTPLHEGAGPRGAGYLTHALGLVPEGPGVHTLMWHLEPGEVLLLCSDGLLDAGLDRGTVGAILTRASELEEGVNDLARRVLRRMGTYRAKPDNLTLVAARRRRLEAASPPAEPESPDV